MRIATPLLATTLLAGCSAIGGDFRPDADGQEGQITVVIDSAHWAGAVGDSLRATLEAPIVTLPSREPHFALEPVHLTGQKALEMAQTRRNVLFVGAIGDTLSNEGRWLYHRLDDEARGSILAGTSAMIARSDEWRRRQQVYYAVAGTPEALAVAISENSEDLIYAFNLATRRRMYREMFDIGRQRDQEAYLMERHNFAVNVQHDYVIATDTSNFVWLRRILSDTWRSLFVYYQERMDPTSLIPENVLLLRDALTRQHMEGTEGGILEVVLTQPITVDSIDFRGRFGYEIRGLWEMVGEEGGRRFQYGQGGGFVTYAFYDVPSGRLYVIDGMLYAPGYPKREFLRQLEVIAYTFRTAQDVAAAASG